MGSGPNGLVAANILADHGWSVEVLETASDPGGAVRSGELTLPGFVHDRFSWFYPFAADSAAIGALQLERHGLRWRHHPLPVAHPRRDGSVAYIAPEVEDTIAYTESFAPGDGAARRALHGALGSHRRARARRTVHPDVAQGRGHLQGRPDWRPLTSLRSSPVARSSAGCSRRWRRPSASRLPKAAAAR
jgi:phytoene dehydrogenase-like protein